MAWPPACRSVSTYRSLHPRRHRLACQPNDAVPPSCQAPTRRGYTSRSSLSDPCAQPRFDPCPWWSVGVPGRDRLRKSEPRGDGRTHRLAHEKLTAVVEAAATVATRRVRIAFDACGLGRQTQATDRSNADAVELPPGKRMIRGHASARNLCGTP